MSATSVTPDITINEATSELIVVSFKDEDGNPVAPSSVTWKIDCLTTGQSILGETSVSPATSVNLQLTPAYTAILDSRNREEFKLVTVVATYLGGQQEQQQFTVKVVNLSFVGADAGPTIDITIGGVNSNSYVTEDEASTYFLQRLYSDTWDAASVADRRKALINSTRLLDDYIKWRGSPVNINSDNRQALGWPRYGVFDNDGVYIEDDEIPVEVKIATLELALILLNGAREVEGDSDGLSSVSVSGISVVFDKASPKSVVPDFIFRKISHLGTRTDKSGSGMRFLSRA